MNREYETTWNTFVNWNWRRWLIGFAVSGKPDFLGTEYGVKSHRGATLHFGPLLLDVTRVVSETQQSLTARGVDPDFYF